MYSTTFTWIFVSLSFTVSDRRLVYIVSVAISRYRHRRNVRARQKSKIRHLLDRDAFGRVVDHAVRHDLHESRLWHHQTNGFVSRFTEEKTRNNITLCAQVEFCWDSRIMVFFFAYILYMCVCRRTIFELEDFHNVKTIIKTLIQYGYFTGFWRILATRWSSIICTGRFIYGVYLITPGCWPASWRKSWENERWNFLR